MLAAAAGGPRSTTGQPPLRESNANDGRLFLDLLDRVELALAAAGAGFARGLPGFGGLQVGIPEWPGAALAGAVFVHGAAMGFRVEKNAVVVLPLLERAADADLADVLFFE